MSIDDLRALREFEGAGLPATERDRPARITTTMPAEVVTQLRGALYAELGRVVRGRAGGKAKVTHARRMDAHDETPERSAQWTEHDWLGHARRAAVADDRARRWH